MVQFAVSPDAPAVRFGEARLSNDLCLRYVEQGPAEGDAVLMLHGISDSSFSFSRVLPLLPPTMRVIVPDQRGHGDSDRPTGSYSMDEFALDALELLDVLKVSRMALVGHSMGSFIARRLAAFAGARVAQLVLIGAGPSGDNAAVREVAAAIGKLTDPVDPVFVREFQVATSSDTLPPEFLERVIAESLKLPARVWKASIDGILAYTAADDQIECDTLIMGGDLDPVFSAAEQQELAHRIRGARVKLFAGIGHALHWDNPKALARAIS